MNTISFICQGPLKSSIKPLTRRLKQFGSLFFCSEGFSLFRSSCTAAVARLKHCRSRSSFLTIIILNTKNFSGEIYVGTLSGAEMCWNNILLIELFSRALCASEVSGKCQLGRLMFQSHETTMYETFLVWKFKRKISEASEKWTQTVVKFWVIFSTFTSFNFRSSSSLI